MTAAQRGRPRRHEERRRAGGVLLSPTARASTISRAAAWSWSIPYRADGAIRLVPR